MKKKRLVKLWQSLAILVSLGFLFGSVSVVWAITLPIPDFDQFFQERVISQSTKIYDRTGQVVLYDVHSNVKRTVIPFDQISPFIKKAAVAIEDADFYNHTGFKPSSILRAFLVNVSTGEVRQGGSTITQQVIKMTILNKDKKLSRKIKELVLALKLEREMTKDEILALYLNEAPYGGSLYGIEAASKSFFGKSAKDLTLPEAAYLAAIPQAPTFYSPYGNNRQKLDDRKNLVLDRMVSSGYITKDEAVAAKKIEVAFLPSEERGIKAPHFVFFIKSYLEEKYGQEVVEAGGLSVITTLDWEMQKAAEETVKKYADANLGNFNAKNMSLVAIDPKTGQILAMVGSKDYFDIENDGNFNIALAHRQPGSAFKPFVYAAALLKGFTPETVVFDLPTQFSTNCPPDCYEPQNYDDKFVGPITLKDALAQSRNIPAVKALYLAGLDNSLRLARDFGITSLTDKDRYGLTLVLGGGEISLLELTSAYSVFANDGVRNPYEKILEIKDGNGVVLEKFGDKSKVVIDPNIPRQINDILSDPVARQPLFGNLFSFDRGVALKTGTTNDYRDAWIVGYTPNLVVGAWAGNNDNTPMAKKVSGLIIAPMWNDFMKQQLPKLPVEDFIPANPTPNNLKPILRGFWQGGESYVVDKLSGKLATNLTPIESRQERVVMNPHSILYWVNKNDPQGPQPSNPANDPQYNLWEEPVQKWVAAQGLKLESASIIPQDFDNVHRTETAPDFTLNIAGTSQLNSIITLSVKNLNSTYSINQVDYFINDQFLGSVNKSPYEFSFNPMDFNVVSGSATIKAVAYDLLKNKTEKTRVINLE